jgi:hypothetical protein
MKCLKTFNIKTVGITTLSIMDLFATLRITTLCIFNVNMLIVVILNVVAPPLCNKKVIAKRTKQNFSTVDLIY